MQIYFIANGMKGIAGKELGRVKPIRGDSIGRGLGKRRNNIVKNNNYTNMYSMRSKSSRGRETLDGKK